MKYLIALLLLVFISCSQEGMTEEQRAKLKDEKAARKIQRVTEADILVAAKSKAAEIYKQALGDNNAQRKMKWIALEDTSASIYEQKMQEAYQYAIDQGLAQYDNIEDLGNGQLIFTMPEQLQDSIPGFWVITLDKKEVIKGMH